MGPSVHLNRYERGKQSAVLVGKPADTAFRDDAADEHSGFGFQLAESVLERNDFVADPCLVESPLACDVLNIRLKGFAGALVVGPKARPLARTEVSQEKARNVVVNGGHEWVSTGRPSAEDL